MDVVSRTPRASVANTRRILERDVYGYEVLQDLGGLADDVVDDLLSSLGAVLFKPEAIVTRKVHDGLAALAAELFTPVLVREVTLNRNVVRVQWQNSPDLMHPTRGFCALLDVYLTSMPWLYVLVESKRPPDGVTASRRLAEFKGPSRRDARRPHHLRSRLAAEQAPPLFTFVHAADDENDFVRELAVFFGAAERTSIWDSVIAGCRTDPSRHVDDLYSRFPARELDLEPALARIGAHSRHLSSRHEIEAWCDSAYRREPVDWLRLVGLIESGGGGVDGWDLIVVGAHVTSLPPRT